MQTSVSDRSAGETSIELFQELFTRVLEGESPLFEWRAIRPKDGHEFPVEIFLQRILIDGEYRAMATVRDITGRKQAEEAVQVMMQNIVDGIIIHDLDGRVIYVNQVMLEMYGVTQEEALQYDVFIYSARDVPRYIIQGTWRKVLDGTVVNDEWECQRPKDGKLFPVELYLRRIYLNGKMLVMTMVRDISIRKQAESLLKEAHKQLAESYHQLQQANDELEDKVVSRTQELQSMNQELQAINIELLDLNDSLAREIDERRRMEGKLAEANLDLSKALENLRSTQSQLVQAEKMASLGTLVAGVAHEINSPVGVGVTAASHLEKITHEFLRLYENGSMNKPEVEAYLEDCREAVKIVLSNLERASRLIRSFKQVSADQSSEDRRRFDVCHYLQEIVISMQPQLKKARINASVRCQEGIIVDSYPGAFAQILTNLIMNSLMHAYGTEDTGRISIEVQPSDSGILLIYRDDGRGMDQETREKIYDPFFTTRRGSGGTGLGMYIIYNLVYQQFHGTIDCQSRPGKGTTFIMRLDMGGTSA